MPKKSVTFRLREDVLDRLAEVSERSGLTRTAIIEGLIMGKTSESDAEQRLVIEKVVERSLPVSSNRSKPDRDKLAAFAQQNMAKGKKS